MDIILSFPSLNGGYYYENFPMDDLKKKNWLFLFEGNAKQFAFPCDGYHWCIKLCLTFVVFEILFWSQKKAIFKSKVKNSYLH